VRVFVPTGASAARKLYDAARSIVAARQDLSPKQQALLKQAIARSAMQPESRVEITGIAPFRDSAKTAGVKVEAKITGLSNSTAASVAELLTRGRVKARLIAAGFAEAISLEPAQHRRGQDSEPQQSGEKK
jgi:hypothetical protein